MEELSKIPRESPRNESDRGSRLIGSGYQTAKVRVGRRSSTMCEPSVSWRKAKRAIQQKTVHMRREEVD